MRSIGSAVRNPKGAAIGEKARRSRKNKGVAELGHIANHLVERGVLLLQLHNALRSRCCPVRFPNSGGIDAEKQSIADLGGLVGVGSSARTVEVLDKYSAGFRSVCSPEFGAELRGVRGR